MCFLSHKIVVTLEFRVKIWEFPLTLGISVYEDKVEEYETMEQCRT